MVYRWTQGMALFADAQKVGEELEPLGKRVSPLAVVKYAEEHPEGELYRCFVWDDKAAAELHRTETARIILKSIQVIRTGQPGSVKKDIVIKAYRENPGLGSGERFARTGTDEEMGRRALHETMAALSRLEMKLEAYRDFLPAAGEAMERVKEIRRLLCASDVVREAS